MRYCYLITFCLILFACDHLTPTDEATTTETTNEDFVWSPEKFADKKIVRYQIPGWEKLSAQQQAYVYHLVEAGLAGRDIMYDQNYEHNLEIRKALDKISRDYLGARTGPEWEALDTYAKNVWFSNGIHHHYSMDKFEPGFSEAFFDGLLGEVRGKLSPEARAAIFDPSVAPKKVVLNADVDKVAASAVNFYGEGVTQAAVEAYYKSLKDEDPERPVSHGLNSRLMLGADGQLVEEVYSAQGKYGPAIQQIIKHLQAAQAVAETPKQAEALGLLIEYYQTGDLRKWDDYNIAWVAATEGDIDYINGFVEVYNDPLGYTGSYENIVQIKDFEASERMAAVAKEAQYFEDNSPILDEHKKKNVTGISYQVVAVAGEAGDASPATPIGVNLPNADWIRAEHGSKSVSLGNIIEAYDKAGGPGILKEFAYDEAEVARSEKYAGIGDKMSTALHEVIGHASGQLNPGIGTPKQTLKENASALEEARADLVALYYIMDPKLQEMGLLESDEVAKAEYDGYIRNGLMTQLRRIEPGQDIEESHMRNRQLISSWAYEQGQAENVIEKISRDGKTYFRINDYAKLRALFGELLRDIQRIKSEGDYEAGRALVETYGTKVDQAMHQEVLRRTESMNIPPYGGFINPVLVADKDADGNVTTVRVTYPDDFRKQMLDYAERYGHL